MSVTDSYLRRGFGLVDSALGRGAPRLRRPKVSRPPRVELSVPPGCGDGGHLSGLAGLVAVPLAHLSGTAELLLESPLAPVQQSYVRAIAAWAEDIRQGIDRVLRSEPGAPMLQSAAIEDVSVTELVSAVLKVLAGPAREKGVRFVATVETDVPAILPIDRQGLRRLLVHLCADALKRTADAGEVSLRILRVTDGLRIVVMEGVPARDRPHVRQSAAVVALAQGMQGEVDILDAEEGGAVSVTLPLAPDLPGPLGAAVDRASVAIATIPAGVEALLEHLSRELLLTRA